jgi:2-C-methyl-D-erythritol 2,4-cyclodiphosphate synthase
MSKEDSPCWLPLSGIGYDVHAFAENRPLVLGGVEIPFHKGLDGHSDADVLCHAIADAILGAVGERDIGHHFPNTDDAYRGISSIELLHRVGAILTARGARLMNIDSTLIAEAPKVGPHVAKMRANISKALGISCERVGVKATTNERMGFVGREEGIAAFAVASVIMLQPAADPESSI